MADNDSKNQSSGEDALYDDLFTTTQEDTDDTVNPQSEVEESDLGTTTTDLDLYDDIITEEVKQKEDSYKELCKKLETAMLTLRTLETENQSLRKVVKQHTVAKETVEKNMSSLLKTARIEITRKEKEISSLRKRLQMPRKSQTSFSRLRQNTQKTESLSSSSIDTSLEPIFVSSPAGNRLKSRRVVSEESTWDDTDTVDESVCHKNLERPSWTNRLSRVDESDRESDAKMKDDNKRYVDKRHSTKDINNDRDKKHSNKDVNIDRDRRNSSRKKSENNEDIRGRPSSRRDEDKKENHISLKDSEKTSNLNCINRSRGESSKTVSSPEKVNDNYRRNKSKQEYTSNSEGTDENSRKYSKSSRRDDKDRKKLDSKYEHSRERSRSRERGKKDKYMYTDNSEGNDKVKDKEKERSRDLDTRRKEDPISSRTRQRDQGQCGDLREKLRLKHQEKTEQAPKQDICDKFASSLPNAKKDDEKKETKIEQKTPKRSKNIKVDLDSEIAFLSQLKNNIRKEKTQVQEKVGERCLSRDVADKKVKPPVDQNKTNERVSIQYSDLDLSLEDEPVKISMKAMETTKKIKDSGDVLDNNCVGNPSNENNVELLGHAQLESSSVMEDTDEQVPADNASEDEIAVRSLLSELEPENEGSEMDVTESQTLMETDKAELCSTDEKEVVKNERSVVDVLDTKCAQAELCASSSEVIFQKMDTEEDDLQVSNVNYDKHSSSSVNHGDTNCNGEAESKIKENVISKKSASKLELLPAESPIRSVRVETVSSVASSQASDSLSEMFQTIDAANAKSNGEENQNSKVTTATADTKLQNKVADTKLQNKVADTKLQNRVCSRLDCDIKVSHLHPKRKSDSGDKLKVNTDVMVEKKDCVEDVNKSEEDSFGSNVISEQTEPWNSSSSVSGSSVSGESTDESSSSCDSDSDGSYTDSEDTDYSSDHEPETGKDGSEKTSELSGLVNFEKAEKTADVVKESEKVDNTGTSVKENDVKKVDAEIESNVKNQSTEKVKDKVEEKVLSPKDDSPGKRSVINTSVDKSFLLQSLLCGVETVMQSKQLETSINGECLPSEKHNASLSTKNKENLNKKNSKCDIEDRLMNSKVLTSPQKLKSNDSKELERIEICNESESLKNTSQLAPKKDMNELKENSDEVNVFGSTLSLSSDSSDESSSYSSYSSDSSDSDSDCSSCSYSSSVSSSSSVSVKKSPKTLDIMTDSNSVKTDHIKQSENKEEPNAKVSCKSKKYIESQVIEDNDRDIECVEAVHDESRMTKEPTKKTETVAKPPAYTEEKTNSSKIKTSILTETVTANKTPKCGLDKSIPVKTSSSGSNPVITQPPVAVICQVGQKSLQPNPFIEQDEQPDFFINLGKNTSTPQKIVPYKSGAVKTLSPAAKFKNFKLSPEKRNEKCETNIASAKSDLSANISSIDSIVISSKDRKKDSKKSSDDSNLAMREKSKSSDKTARTCNSKGHKKSERSDCSPKTEKKEREIPVSGKKKNHVSEETTNVRSNSEGGVTSLRKSPRKKVSSLKENIPFEAVKEKQNSKEQNKESKDNVENNRKSAKSGSNSEQLSASAKVCSEKENKSRDSMKGKKSDSNKTKNLEETDKGCKIKPCQVKVLRDTEQELIDKMLNIRDQYDLAKLELASKQSRNLSVFSALSNKESGSKEKVLNKKEQGKNVAKSKSPKSSSIKAKQKAVKSPEILNASQKSPQRLAQKSKTKSKREPLILKVKIPTYSQVNKCFVDHKDRKEPLKERPLKSNRRKSDEVKISPSEKRKKSLTDAKVKSLVADKFKTKFKPNESSSSSKELNDSAFGITQRKKSPRTVKPQKKDVSHSESSSSMTESDTEESSIITEDTDDDTEKLVKAVFGSTDSSGNSKKSFTLSDIQKTRSSEGTDGIVKDNKGDDNEGKNKKIQSSVSASKSVSDTKQTETVSNPKLPETEKSSEKVKSEVNQDIGRQCKERKIEVNKQHLPTKSKGGKPATDLVNSQTGNKFQNKKCDKLNKSVTKLNKSVTKLNKSVTDSERAVLKSPDGKKRTTTNKSEHKLSTNDGKKGTEKEDQFLLLDDDSMDYIDYDDSMTLDFGEGNNELDNQSESESLHQAKEQSITKGYKEDGEVSEEGEIEDSDSEEEDSVTDKKILSKPNKKQSATPKKTLLNKHSFLTESKFSPIKFPDSSDFDAEQNQRIKKGRMRTPKKSVPKRILSDSESGSDVMSPYDRKRRNCSRIKDRQKYSSPSGGYRGRLRSSKSPEYSQRDKERRRSRGTRSPRRVPERSRHRSRSGSRKRTRSRERLKRRRSPSFETEVDSPRAYKPRRRDRSDSRQRRVSNRERRLNRLRSDSVSSCNDSMFEDRRKRRSSNRDSGRSQRSETGDKTSVRSMRRDRYQDSGRREESDSSDSEVPCPKRRRYVSSSDSES